METGTAVGIYLALFASIGIFAGSLLAMRDERLSKRGRPTDPTGRPVAAAPEPELVCAAAVPVTFERLNRWDWVAFLAALALLFTMAVDWYSTVQGEEARRIERIEDPNAGAERPDRPRGRGARRRAGRGRRAQRACSPSGLRGRPDPGAASSPRWPSRPWPPSPARPAGASSPPGTPSAAAAFDRGAAALLVAYRIVQQPGSDIGTTVKAGVPLALIVLAVVAYASSRALKLEEEGTAFRAVEAPAA